LSVLFANSQNQPDSKKPFNSSSLDFAWDSSAVFCDLFYIAMSSSLDKYFGFFRWLDKKNSKYFSFK
jgi:hypothetical protein